MGRVAALIASHRHGRQRNGESLWGITADNFDQRLLQNQGIVQGAGNKLLIALEQPVHRCNEFLAGVAGGLAQGLVQNVRVH
jgi:hypothetical protein